MTVGGRATNADVLAGYQPDQLVASNADVQIGKVAVLGDWTHSRILAGETSTDSIFGNSDDKIFSGGGSATINSKIASIIFGGAVRGSSALNDGSGFVAQDIGSLTISGTKIPLNSSPFADFLILGSSADVFLREVAAI